jgi:hypothetical protein
LLTDHSPHSPFLAILVAIHTVVSSAVLLQLAFGVPSPGFPGLVSKDENSTSNSDVSVILTGVDQEGCCKTPPSDAKILVDAHSVSEPPGMPSDQPFAG